MHSAIYRGWLRHRRHQPRGHGFSYPVFMMYLDLAELDTAFRGRWLWSAQPGRRPLALARFDRGDHFGDRDTPLDHCVRELVAAHTGRRPAGPIRLLTNLRCFGYVFNPVSFYYCFEAGSEAIEAIVAEVNNTPWGERHCYVLDCTGGASVPRVPSSAGPMRFHSDKVFHVSPFLPMDLAYDWRVSPPGERLNVHIALRRRGAPAGPAQPRVFDATLSLQRRPLDGRQLAAVLARHPLMAMKVVLAIHWQALRLWLKRIPFHPHPGPRAGLPSDRAP